MKHTALTQPLSQVSPGTEAAIWVRLLQPGGKTLSLAAARSLLRLEFSPQDKARMRELASKASEGTLAANEQVEIRNYEQVGNVLALMQSQARQRLKKAGAAIGTSS